jgi:hypothetical protein
MRCPMCGVENVPGAPACTACGQTLNQAAPTVRVRVSRLALAASPPTGGTRCSSTTHRPGEGEEGLFWGAQVFRECQHGGRRFPLLAFTLGMR